MDLTDTIAPTSDQLDAVDLLTGPRTFTIESVSKGSIEQPVNIHLAEFARVWRPGKSMRRVLVAIWGADGTKYVGRRLTLYCDPTVQFGGAEVGGTRISHMSHLDKPKTVSLLVTRGRSAPFRVQPLRDDPPSSPEVSLVLRIEQAIAAFKNGGVTQEQLQKRLGKSAEDWTAGDVADLELLFQSLKKREISKDEAFPPVADDSTSTPEPAGAARQAPDDVDPTLDPTWGQS